MSVRTNYLVSRMNVKELANKVVVRLATIKDLAFVHAITDGYDEEPIDVVINRARIKEIAPGMINAHCVLMGEINGETIGLIAGYKLPCLFSDDVLFSTMFFYVLPYWRRYTKDFLKEIELCLTPTNITRIVIAVPAFKQFAARRRFMKIMGYKTLEEQFYKRI